jgi:hypothetical protein
MTRKSPAKKPMKGKPKAKTPANRKVSKRLKAFVVYRQIRGDSGEFVDVVPDRVFATPETAQRHADALNREVRAVCNPFHRDYVDALIKGGEKSLLKLIATLGLHPPAKIRVHGQEYTQWVAWWDSNYFDMTDAQREAIWNALDKFNWYKVKTTTVEG